MEMSSTSAPQTGHSKMSPTAASSGITIFPFSLEEQFGSGQETVFVI